MTEPSKEELIAELTQLRVQVAAFEQERRTQRKLAGQKQVLELIATGASCDKVLHVLATNVEEQGSGLLCSIMLLSTDGTTLSFKSAPSLPEGYQRSIGEVVIGPDVGSCGTAAYLGKLVITSDIASDPRWENYRQYALEYGLRASWSIPIFSTAGKVLGVFGMYYREPCQPDPASLELMHEAAQLAGIAIERSQVEEALNQSETHLRLSQRMEAVGRLAGGIAHDFNNLLSAILGYTGLILHSLDLADPVREDVREIEKAAERAADLTQQLLAFSRRQMLQPKVLDLNAIVTDMDKLLRRLVSEDITIQVNLDPKLDRIKADSGQIEQVLMNLAVNARDAMGSGGKLIIETSNVELDATYASRHTAVKPGSYILLAVSDNGTGMDEETISHIFEPFFTTKEQGKGTGMGLSTVYGIVKQSGGNIWVYSEVGLGTTFKIYLPAVSEPVAPIAPRPVPIRRAGSETILLVEDEEVVRALAYRLLHNDGYKVLQARDGLQALEICRQYRSRIDLLLTDVVMPRMSGRDLATQLKLWYPHLRILYMSGYTDTAIVHHGVLDPNTAFIQKPFTAEGLTTKIREVLDVE